LPGEEKKPGPMGKKGIVEELLGAMARISTTPGRKDQDQDLSADSPVAERDKRAVMHLNMP